MSINKQTLAANMTTYLDCAATTPIDPDVRDVFLHHLELEFGNAGSRTHEFGLRAKKAVQLAREQVAEVVNAKPQEVIFTSGATESNNIAILGLEKVGRQTGRMHIVTSSIEHKAVLEPCEELERRGFSVTYVAPEKDGRLNACKVLEEVTDETLLVSIMHVNNETGAIQPVAEVGQGLANSKTYFHVDAAQGYGKEFDQLAQDYVQLISVSGHKLYGPMGVGALIARRSGERIPIAPLMFGGGQEYGIRPGTVAVPLVAALGKAAELAGANKGARLKACLEVRSRMLAAFEPLGAVINGELDHTIHTILNFSIPGLDSEAIILCTKEIAAISNGSACTSASYEPSHVLRAMQLSDERIESACRLSWCHATVEPDWDEFAGRMKMIL